MSGTKELMMALQSGLLVALAVFLVGQCLFSRFAWVQDLVMARLARQVGLGIPADLESVIRPRIALRMLGGGIGGLLGLAVGVIALVPTRMPYDIIYIFVVLAIASAGIGIGTIWASVRAELRVPRVGTRSARIRVVTVSDYIFLPIRFVAWGVVIISAVLVILSLAAVPTGRVVTLRSGAAFPDNAFLFASGACLILFELVARWFVGRGQPAASTDELVWSDALRSRDLNTFLGDTVRLVFLGVWFPLATSLVTSRKPGVTALIAVAMTVVFLLMLTFRFLTWSTRGWYLERLWHGSRRRTAAEEARRLDEVERRAEAERVDEMRRVGERQRTGEDTRLRGTASR